MDFHKAISILGLNQNFTEEELKTAYRNLSREYHPDKYEGKPEYEQMQKKQQEINAAREFLKNHLKASSATNTFDIKDYIALKKSALSKIINVDGETITDKDFISTRKAVKKIINEFETNVFNFYVLTKEEVDSEYNGCIKKIKSKFEILKNFFYTRNYINKDEVKENLNYNCTLKEFYEQLQKIESKYGKKAKIKQQLLLEIQKYQYFNGYEKLETLINVSLKNALIAIKQDGFKNIEKHIDEMNQEILLTFQTYHKLIQTIRELSQEVLACKDEKIQNAYEELKNNFENGSSFSDIELEITNLKKLIQEHQKEMQQRINFHQNEQAINIVYQSLLDKYNKIIKNYNIVTDYENINKISVFLNQLLKVFARGCDELESLEFFNLFSQITFINIENDKEIVKEILSRLKQNKSNIYIKTINQYMFDDTSFFYFDEENMIMYKDDYGKISCQKITEEELETEYISVEKILESAVYIGDYRKILGTIPVKYLYETDKIAIYSQGNKFQVKPKSKLYNIQPIKPADDSFEPFKDKQHVCEMIEKQIKERIEEYKKQHSQTSSTYSPDSRIFGETPFNDTDQYRENPPGSRRK